MSFFSYQPSQGLSAFRTKPLQRTGSGGQEFIDPTLEASEGIDDLSMGDNTLDPRTLTEGSGGGMMSTTTGTQFGVSDQLRGLLDEQSQNPQAATTAAQGPQDGGDNTAQAIKNVVSGAQTAQKLAKAAEGSSLFGPEKQSTEGLDLQTPETDWTSPAAVGSYLQNNPQSKLGLYAREFNQTPEDVSSMIGQGGSPFDLGADTQLDSSFLDSFNTTTGTRVGGFGDMDASGFTGAPNASVGGGIAALQGVLSIVAGASKGEVGNLLGGSVQLASGLANIFPKQIDAIGEVLKASLTEAGLGGLLEGGGELLDSIGIESLGNVSVYIQVAKGLFDIAMVATNDKLSDGDKAIEATKAATKVVAAIAAPYTFGASLAVTQIWDLVDNLRAGLPLDEAMVRAADPTSLVDMKGGGLANRLYSPSKDWMSFVPELMQNQENQGEAFNMIQKALPYVRNKQELAALIDAAEGWTSQVTGIPLGTINQNPDPYVFETIPGVGPKTHGQRTTPVDWGAPTLQMRDIINAYRDVLPGELAVGPQGGGFATPDAYGRLWDQFRGKDPTWGAIQHVPGFSIEDYPRTWSNDESPSDMGPDMSQPQQGSWAGTYYGETTPANWSGSLQDFQYGYDPDVSRLTALRPGGARPKTMEEAYQPSASWYQFMTGIDPTQVAEQQAALANQPANQQGQQQQGLSQFNPENQQPVDDRGIPDDGHPDHPYELDQQGRPVHPEVWGIPGMRMGGQGA